VVLQGAAHDAQKETKGYVETAKDKVNSLLGTGEKKANEAGDKANELGSKAGAHAEDAQKQGKSAFLVPQPTLCQKKVEAPGTMRMQGLPSASLYARRVPPVSYRGARQCAISCHASPQTFLS
jgi:hypothetical protein